MECIAVINQKGGVGKTSTAANLGAGLAQRGLRMLLVDLDPQGHLTTHFGLDAEAPDRGIYEVLTRNMPIAEATHVYSPTISVVPAHVDLAAAEPELLSVVGREVILQGALSKVKNQYDMVLFDCPPSLSVLSLNALCAASRVLIPVQPHFLALQGAGKLFETISLVGQRINPGLSVLGIVMCLYDAGTRLSSEVVDDLSGFLDGHRDQDVPWQNARIFKSKIRRNVKLAECPSYGQSIFEYAPRSNGAIDYLALADEVLACLNGTIDQFPGQSSEVATSDTDEIVVDSMSGDASKAAASPDESDSINAKAKIKDAPDINPPARSDKLTKASNNNGQHESHSAPVETVDPSINRQPPVRKPPAVAKRQAS